MLGRFAPSHMLASARYRLGLVPPPPTPGVGPPPKERAAFGRHCMALAKQGKLDEVRAAAVDADFAMFEGMRPKRFHDMTAEERAIFSEVSYFSCQMPESVAQLCRVVEHLTTHKIAGDFVECGVYLGASIISIIRTLQRLGVTDRDIWLYDTFEGMPEPQAVDVFYADGPEGAREFWDKIKREDGGSDWVRAEVSAVQSNIAHVTYPAERMHFVKGLVEDTIPATMPDKIALLRLDTDFYSSTKHEFVHLYPRVVSGGVVIIDDYGGYRGSQKATDEYLKEQGLPVLLFRIDEHVRMFVKP